MRDRYTSLNENGIRFAWDASGPQQHISAQVPSSYVVALRKRANEESRTLSAQLRLAIAEHLAHRDVAGDLATGLIGVLDAVGKAHDALLLDPAGIDEARDWLARAGALGQAAIATATERTWKVLA